MILLLGGTADTSPLATLLAEAGYEVLVSTATGIPLATGDHPRISRREGPLDKNDLTALAGELDVRAIIDATHPYAEDARRNARAAAACARIPYLTYIRPPVITPAGDVIPARNHEEAAKLAFSLNHPVLLTTGSRNLSPYAAAARQSGINLVVRVLDQPESLEACRKAGIPTPNIVTGRGPFTIEQNVQIIRKFAIGVVVTKDGGAAGGVNAKSEAARREKCALVVVSRPGAPNHDAFDNMDDLLAALRTKISSGG